ncbi:MAG: hypothetical protein ACRDOF_04120 [Gaiellaceae bacterium]
MRSWLSWLVRERLAEVALALALGTAVAALAEKLVDIPVAVLAQNVGRDPFRQEDVIDLLSVLGGSAPYYLNFSLGNTAIIYGQVLADFVTFGLVAVITALVVRRRDRELGICPFCASRIPHESRHCAYCGSGVEPGEP